MVKHWYTLLRSVSAASSFLRFSCSAAVFAGLTAGHAFWGVRPFPLPLCCVVCTVFRRNCVESWTMLASGAASSVRGGPSDGALPSPRMVSALKSPLTTCSLLVRWQRPRGRRLRRPRLRRARVPLRDRPARPALLRGLQPLPQWQVRVAVTVKASAVAVAAASVGEVAPAPAGWVPARPFFLAYAPMTRPFFFQHHRTTAPVGSGLCQSRFGCRLRQTASRRDSSCLTVGCHQRACSSSSVRLMCLLSGSACCHLRTVNVAGLEERIAVITAAVAAVTAVAVAGVAAAAMATVAAVTTVTVVVAMAYGMVRVAGAMA